MNEHELGGRMARHLDASAHDLKPEVLDRLYAARKAAVARVPAETTARVFAWSGGALGLSALGGDRRYALAMGIMLVAIISTYYYWQNQATPSELDELEVLAGDLPVNAYLDKGFDKWVTGSLSR